MDTTPRISDAELVHRLRVVRDLEKEGKTREQIAAALEIKASSLRESIREAKARNLTADTVIRDPLEAAKQEVRRLKAEIKSIHKHNDTAEEIRKTIYQLRGIDLEPPKWLMSDAKIEGPGTPMMIWSDWHFGETVNKNEVGGMNEFNSDIAEERVRVLVERSLGLIRHHMPDGVPGAVICLGGDMITGEIHQELADTNDKYVLQSVRQLKSVIADALTRVADQCGRVYVPCVVGNHGRATLKPRLKGRVFTNYEWNIYTDLEDRLRGDKRIKFSIPDETDITFAVQGHRFLLTHGDTLGVKGGDGIIGALGPILRGAFKVGRSESQIGREFDTILMGHWHQYVSLRGVIVNNCLKGYDEFAKLVLRAPASPASQALWFVHKKWGINTAMEVYAQEPFRAKQTRDAPWVSILDKGV